MWNKEQLELNQMNDSENIKMDDNCEIIVKGGKFYLFTKRFFDILLSGLALIVLSWLILLIMLIKFCEDWHNPIYTSKRVGLNGRIIKFHKIRSMCPHAESLKRQLIEQGLNEADGPVFKMKNDPRITKVGRFLRKTSLDELPQLWDIFVGSLSIVGPRSPIPSEVIKYNHYQMNRLRVKGGLLCLWQIQKNRHQISFDDWIKLDVEYIQKRSLWLDFKIIVIGFIRVIFDRSGE